VSHAAVSAYRVPDDGSFRVRRAATTPPADRPSKKQLRKGLAELVARFDELQRRLYAEDRNALLLVFQAMDAAGKDGTIRAVTSGVDPAGFQVFSFKQPSTLELEHDFLWRTARRLPERGRVGVFNRSYYEEVLVVRVHPEYLEHQRLPRDVTGDELWAHRFRSIREHERHLHANGTVVLKFWLNVSKEEQRRRFLDRIAVAEKNWKFSTGDVREREHWDRYMHAYEQALNATSRPWAPWYAIPADHKPYMRYAVADIVVRTLENLDPHYPQVGARKKAELKEMRGLLEDAGDPAA
jgi:PPK2 family polyphosphate:nucleotide phosphotransferase